MFSKNVSFLLSYMPYVQIVCKILCIYVKFRTHKWEETCNVCLSEIDAILLNWLSPLASIFLQMNINFGLHRWKKNSIMCIYHIFFLLLLNLFNFIENRYFWYNIFWLWFPLSQLFWDLSHLPSHPHPFCPSLENNQASKK